MKLAKLIMITTACLANTIAVAGSLKIPDSVEILALDGKSVKRWEELKINDIKTQSNF